jgi:hypothetical protein
MTEQSPGDHPGSPLDESGGGSAGPATAGLLRIGTTVGAAIGDRRVLEPLEGTIMLVAGAVLLGLALLIALFPRAFAYAVAATIVWPALALLYRGMRLRRQAEHEKDSLDSRR